MIKKLFYLENSAKHVVLLILYILFFLYIGSLILREPTLPGKIAYLLILIIFGGIAAWYEGLKWILYQATRHTILTENRQRAQFFLSLIDKLDFPGVFSSPARILRLMLLWDYGEFRQMAMEGKEVLSGEKGSDPETKLIFRRFCFIACGEMGDMEDCADYYRLLSDMRIACLNNKSWLKHPYFSWDEIDGAYRFYRGQYASGLKAAQKVSTARMNNREKMHHSYLLARLFQGDGQTGEACRQLDAAISFAGENSYMARLLEGKKREWLDGCGQTKGPAV